MKCARCVALLVAQASAFAPTLNFGAPARPAVVDTRARLQPRPCRARLQMSDVFTSASDVLADLEELDSVLGDDRAEADLAPRQPYLNGLAVQAALRKWQRHDKDSGSPEVQAAILTERIVYMTKHLQTHPKDVHSRRGLVNMVNKRRSIMNFLFVHDGPKALELAKTLGIRFRPPSKYETREEKYAAFRSVKSKIGTEIRAKIITRQLRQIEEAKAAAAAK